jgi:hypothetical protein
MTMDLDNTKRSNYVTCPRKYYWQHIRGLLPIYGSTALRYGSGWHGLLEGYYTHIQENGWLKDGEAIKAGVLLAQRIWERESEGREFNADYRTFDNMMKSFLQYLTTFSFEVGMLKVLDTEQVFEIPFTLSPEEKILFPDLEPFVFTGRLDMQVELNGAPWLVENKTTGQWLSTQTERLNRSAQLLGYNYAGLTVLDFKPEGSLVNMHHISSRKNKAGGWSEPKIDFARVPQIFSPGDIEQWRLSFLSTAQDIQRSIRTTHFPMQFDSCYQYGRCAYTQLCEQNRPLEDTNTHNFIVSHWDVRDNTFDDE